MGHYTEARFWVEAVESYEGLLDHVAQWDRLACNSLDINVYLESWMFLPAVRAFKTADTRLVFALIYTRDENDSRILIGFFPFKKLNRYRKKFPCRNLLLWRYGPCFLATPLVHKNYAREAIGTLLDWAEQGPYASTTVELEWVGGSTRFGKEFKDVCNARGSRFICDSYHRALFIPRESAENYLQAALSPRKRRDLRRKARQLELQGKVKFDQLKPGDEVERWLEEFLALEASGWKGRQKSALLSQDSETRFFREMVNAGHELGRVWMTALRLDDRAISMRCNFLSPQGSFFFKPAYDEKYGKYSPGVLLEVETIRWLHESREISWMDSCTSPDNELLNKLWLDKITYLNLGVGSRTVRGHLLTGFHQALRWMKRVANSLRKNDKQ